MTRPDRQPLAPEIEAAIQELDRIEAQTRNARLDWALQSDEPCDLINDLARACEIARFLMSHTQQAERGTLLEAVEALRIGPCWCDTGDGNPHSVACLRAQSLLVDATSDAPAGRKK